MIQVPIDTRLLHPAPVITGMDVVEGERSYRRPQGLANHVLILTLAGHATVGPQGHGLVQRSGDLLLTDPDRSIDQDTPAGQHWSRIWVIFQPRPHWYDWLDWPAPMPGYRLLHLPTIRRGSPVRAHLEAMHRFARSTLRRKGELAMNALEAALLWCDEHNPKSQQARIDPRVVQAMDYIGRNLRGPLTLERLAETAGMSVPHLTRLFRSELNLSPMQFVERERVQRACQLLELTAQPIAAVAQQVGFDDPFYFSTRFRKCTGISPRSYRAGKR